MKQEFKEEAIARMKLLKLDERVITAFEKENRIYMCEKDTMKIIELNSKEQYIINKLEQKNNILVYYILHSFINNETFELLYVEDNKKSWKLEKSDIKRKLINVIEVKTSIEAIGIELKNNKIRRII
ncbi:MAG: hypothetical protein J6M60_06975 [Clostridia bacterium]|nr:hypothetical protein [Clostridia bacterium]